jgi:primosomal protein N' (replication factor Y) (superfamily II helicase)
MRARVVIVGSAGAVEQLTYAVPTELAGRVECGHRVLVPMRSRRLTGLVTALGEELDSGGAEPRAILELLEARPLFDRAHIELIEFLASYYMAPLAEAYRNVIPAVARVESRVMFKRGTPPLPLALATMSALERAIVDAVARKPLTARQLERLGERRDVEAALARLTTEDLIERAEGTRGRHREAAPPLVRLCDGAASATMRGPRQRAVVEYLGANGGVRLDALEAAVAGARMIVRALANRGVVEVIADSAFAVSVASAESAITMQADGARSDGTGATAIASTEAPLELSPEQAAAIAAATPAVRDRRFETFLLWGVTASGKTEVYLRLAAEALAAQRRVLVLVPEIALADQVVRAFRARFGPLVGIAHSAQNVGERWASWMAALSGDARIMIGPRSVVFAPLPDPGLIVVDEEHDSAYKNEEGIRYNARDLAVALGRFANCPVVLGSATPSAESYVNTRRGRYRILRLAHRIGDRKLAEVEIIDLREHLRSEKSQAEKTRIEKSPASDKRGATQQNAESTSQIRGGAGEPEAAPPPDAVPLSAPLIDALRANLASGGQSVVFLNRRGYHNFLQCHLCGNVIACANCSVSMTFHLRDRSMRCHYCGESAPAPEKCPECDGFGLAGQGFGTERLVHTLAELMPDARIERMDSDTSGRRGARATIMANLARGEIDILVGTQMITKGFDFPGVTLVGVVMADLALNMPDFRSAERTFQLLTQVAGRAGRGERAGRVLIQTYAPFHYSIRAARDQDYARFIRRELELRRELMYPPFARMALVRIEGADAVRVGAIAARVAAALGRAAKPDSMRILGPAPAPIERIKRRYRWQVVLKSLELNEMRAALSAMSAETAAMAEDANVHVIIDVDPINML